MAMRTDTSTEIVDSLSRDGSGAISDKGPFSMTEEAVFTLTPAGQLVNRCQTEVKLAVPQPSTWAKCCLALRRASQDPTGKLDRLNRSIVI
jgi:hypothetical protein